MTGRDANVPKEVMLTTSAMSWPKSICEYAYCASPSLLSIALRALVGVVIEPPALGSDTDAETSPADWAVASAAAKIFDNRELAEAVGLMSFVTSSLTAR